jgi:hypothetical protein
MDIWSSIFKLPIKKLKPCHILFFLKHFKKQSVFYYSQRAASHHEAVAVSMSTVPMHYRELLDGPALNFVISILEKSELECTHFIYESKF